VSTYQPITSKALSFQRDELSTAAKFDATLSKSVTGASEYKLTLELRIFLHQINPNPLPHTLDSDGRLFWIKPWSSVEWQSFLNGAKRQAALWNSKFWLKPPATVTDYDYKTSPAAASAPSSVANLTCPSSPSQPLLTPSFPRPTSTPTSI
jgi:hypothetical protein